MVVLVEYRHPYVAITGSICGAVISIEYDAPKDEMPEKDDEKS